ncbi:hypothetical protein sphantq_04716 (plasmid) [Sphingobium sp. AntQ-1]|uniref:hypothetical protein n=1 Tax=Sphingobium sp. AntQ-1 TaxID=2930091 RepID=UPI00234E63F9|nr:hypothetical protein [Sphingobium sp. AntQ-1]WCP16220.1 hypothetical protein sphantq_04716 [Sphingobium sp. AntQ-1]
MIFQDGELRQVENSKPMLFDGWAYVPMETRSVAVEAQLMTEHELATRDALPAPGSR